MVPLQHHSMLISFGNIKISKINLRINDDEPFYINLKNISPLADVLSVCSKLSNWKSLYI